MTPDGKQPTRAINPDWVTLVTHGWAINMRSVPFVSWDETQSEPNVTVYFQDGREDHHKGDDALVILTYIGAADAPWLASRSHGN